MAAPELHPANGKDTPWLIVMAASAGGIQAVMKILSGLPTDFPAALVLVQHRSPHRGGEALGNILRRHTSLSVGTAAEGESMTPGHVYIARADSHLTVAPDRTFLYHDGTKIRFLRSSANPLFESAAQVFDGRVIGVVLSGGGRDATDGVQEVKAHGGIVIAQDQATSAHWDMPRSAIASGAVDYVLPLEAIAPALNDIVHGRPVSAGAGITP